MRDNAIVPALPALLPAVKLYCNCADVQPANVIVATPTGSVTGAGLAGWSKIPPVVSKSVAVIVRVPGE